MASVKWWLCVLMTGCVLTLGAQEEGKAKSTEEPSQSENKKDGEEPAESSETKDGEEKEKPKPVALDLSQYDYAFSRQVASMRKQGLEVVFLFDSTGSMGATLEAAREKIKEIDKIISALVPRYRLGMYAYRDEGEEYEVRGLALNEFHAPAIQFLDDTFAMGGGDYPEGITTAMKTIFKEAGFREEAFKVVFLIGDAPSHDTKKLLKVIDKQNKGCVAGTDEDLEKYKDKIEIRTLINTIQVPLMVPVAGGGMMQAPENSPPVQQTAKEYSKIAEASGGQFEPLANAQAVTGPMLTLVFGKKFEDEINKVVDDIKSGRVFVPLGLEAYSNEQLIDLILSDSPQATAILSKLCDPEAPTVPTSRIEEAITSKSVKDTDRLVGLCQLLARLKQPSSFDALKYLTRKRDVGLQNVALKALSELDHKNIQEIVIKAVDDDDLRDTACRICIDRGWKKAVPLMIKKVKVGKTPPDAIAMGIWKLTGISVYQQMPGNPPKIEVTSQQIKAVKEWIKQNVQN